MADVFLASAHQAFAANEEIAAAFTKVRREIESFTQTFLWL
jgi:hypothetical protein